MSVRRAMAEIDAEEFANWMAYLKLETWDFEGYHQAGIICARVANMLGNKNAMATDYMPLPKRETKGMSIGGAEKVLAARYGS